MEQNLLETVRAGLVECRGEWPKLAIEAGVPYPTLIKVASGETQNPRYRTLQALSLAISARVSAREAA